MQESNISVLQFKTLCQTFFCKAQVAGWQISTPPTLFTTSLNNAGIWIQHMNAQIKAIFGTRASLGTRGLQKVQKINK